MGCLTGRKHSRLGQYRPASATACTLPTCSSDRPFRTPAGSVMVAYRKTRGGHGGKSGSGRRGEGFLILSRRYWRLGDLEPDFPHYVI